jgi:hypothetical protein
VVVPKKAGRFVGNFRLTNVNGVPFGDRIWVLLRVPESAVEVETKTADGEQALVAAAAAAAAAAAEREKAMVQEQEARRVAAAEEQARASAAAVASFMYANELRMLMEMGFTDTELIKALLVTHQGNMQNVADALLRA